MSPMTHGGRGEATAGADGLIGAGRAVWVEAETAAVEMSRPGRPETVCVDAVGPTWAEDEDANAAAVRALISSCLTSETVYYIHGLSLERRNLKKC